ncbi:MAG TPA: SMI1/KNR4 family protein [Verrucomicrobiae bacterium]|jgi:hypothetical protein|nr:SMI1/KNR4 family protein [Verrucomicrobiae bacterium]
MTESDITGIELRLGIRLPSDYRQVMQSLAPENVSGAFWDAQQIVAVNERNRQMSWLGRPLASAYFIFGVDQHGRELFLDLDFPEPVVMVADHEHRRGSVRARTFRDWVSTAATGSAARL